MSSFTKTTRDTYPVVPLRDMVVFPHMMAPFIIGREGSVRALERTLGRGDRNIFLVTQRDPKIEYKKRSFEMFGDMRKNIEQIAFLGIYDSLHFGHLFCAKPLLGQPCQQLCACVREAPQLAQLRRS